MALVINFNNSVLHVGDLVQTNFNQLLRDKYPNSKFIVLTDDNLSKEWVEYLVTEFDVLHGAEIIELPAGEENKNIEICTSVWQALTDYNIGRNDVIINFGGGVITDMGGFIASTFKRGLKFINIPTTLLSQVDASIGGKTGIDLGGYKNQVGTFSSPDLVFIDPKFLTTLKATELVSGYAEMLKHGLIADKNYWLELKQIDLSRNKDLLALIHKSVLLKKEIVESDYDEKGPRKILNFGHTIGHGIEGHFLNQHKTISHGYAVAYGIIAEAYISMKLNDLPEKSFNEIKTHIEKHFGKVALTEVDFDAVLELIKNDKKNKAGEINFSLLTEIGKATFNQNAQAELIIDALKVLVN